MIIYFSGTGNSKYVAKQIGKEQGKEITNMSKFFSGEISYDISTTTPLVIVCPIYAGGLPKVVREFIENINLTSTSKVYIITTCGANSGKINVALRSQLERKGLELYGFEEIVMPSNYIMLYNPPTREEAVQVIKDSSEKIKQVAVNIAQEKGFSIKDEYSLFDKFQSTQFVSSIFHTFLCKDKGFSVSDSCTSCDKCVKICPVDNISITDKYPVWHGNCTHCSGCISICPHEAIEYKSKTQGRNRYFLEDDFEL